MSSFKIFDIAGSGMSAQSVRLNTVASNLANADSVSGDPTSVYQAKHPVFQAVHGQPRRGRPRSEHGAASASRASARARRRPKRATTRAIRSPMRRAMSMRPMSTWSRR